MPCGLGARDTLRFEAGLPLYGHEISRDISPLEGGLGFFVKFKKADYLGKEALLAQKEGGLKRRLVGLTMVDKGVPRAQYPVLDAEGNQVGFVTSGSFSPTVNANVANALVDSAYTEAGTALGWKCASAAWRPGLQNYHFIKGRLKMNIPQDLSDTKEHEWIRAEGNRVTVGITDYAQDQLGDIVFVEPCLPWAMKWRAATALPFWNPSRRPPTYTPPCQGR